METKLIWISGIPYSGKSTIAKKLYLELEWAGEKTAILDDEQLRYVVYQKDVAEIIKRLKVEYIIMVTPFPELLGKRPDLMIYCDSPVEECVKRNPFSSMKDFKDCWGDYYYGKLADITLKTYDRRRKTEDNIEYCWRELKRKMEEVFGDFSWGEYFIR